MIWGFSHIFGSTPFSTYELPPKTRNVLDCAVEIRWPGSHAASMETTGMAWTPTNLEWTKHVHPQKLTWNLEMMVSNRNLLFQGSIFRFHVCFGGCTLSETNMTPRAPENRPKRPKRKFIFKPSIFRWEYVSFREGSPQPGLLQRM